VIRNWLLILISRPGRVSVGVRVFDRNKMEVDVCLETVSVIHIGVVQ